MSRLGISGRTLALIAVLVPLAALFVWVALRSGPLAPVPVTVVGVGEPVDRSGPVRYRHGRSPLHPPDRPDRGRPCAARRCAGGRSGRRRSVDRRDGFRRHRPAPRGAGGGGPARAGRGAGRGRDRSSTPRRAAPSPRPRSGATSSWRPKRWSVRKRSKRAARRARCPPPAAPAPARNSKRPGRSWRARGPSARRCFANAPISRSSPRSPASSWRATSIPGPPPSPGRRSSS